MVVPEPILGWFYEAPDGVLIISIIEDSGAEKAGLQKDDVITGINGSDSSNFLWFTKDWSETGR